jgi:hypothetical protein
LLTVLGRRQTRRRSGSNGLRGRIRAAPDETNEEIEYMQRKSPCSDESGRWDRTHIILDEVVAALQQGAVGSVDSACWTHQAAGLAVWLRICAR